MVCDETLQIMRKRADTTFRGESQRVASHRPAERSREFTLTGMTGEAMIVDRKTITIMKACDLVGVSRRTIYNWIASGKVEYVRTAGGSVRIFVDTLWRKPEDASRRQPMGEH